VKTGDSGLKVDFTPYQIHTLAIQFGAPALLKPPESFPITLAYNLDAFSLSERKSDGDFDAGSTYPGEMIRDEIISEGVKFDIGPRAEGQMNAVSCQGQAVALPKGKFNRVYLLAAAAPGDEEGEFVLDGRPTKLRIQGWSGILGQWDKRVFRGEVPELSYSVTNELERIEAGMIKRDSLAWFASHRHLADGRDAIYSFSYLFKYRLDAPAGAKTLTLPNNPRIRVFAATAADNDNDATMPAQALYDDFTGRKPIVLRSGPITSLLEP
jgi:alpha-mannosidase